MPEFISGPNGLNFNLDAWILVVSPMHRDQLTPDEAVHLRNSLNEYIKLFENTTHSKRYDNAEDMIRSLKEPFDG